MNKKMSGGVARRLIAFAGATALALTGAIAFAAPASAADPFDLPDAPGLLTIHKFVQPDPVGAANDTGVPIDTTGLTPLGNVVFTIAPITGVDLTTEEGWDLAQAYAADPGSAPVGGPVTTVTTGAGGAAPTQTLPIGAYLVTETDYSGATLPDGSAANVVVGSAPFVVTIPVPTGSGTWNTDVHVYPKNSLTEVEKIVSDPDGSGLGSTVTWTVNAALPTLPAGEAFTEFHVTDVLDPRLGYVPGSAELTINGTVIPATVTHTGETAGGTLTVSIPTTDTATLALLDAAQGETISLSFDTIVLGLGEIPNTATVYINQPTTGNGTETNTPETYWGAVEITKHATGDVNALLDGAVFSVYATEADALAGANAIAVDGETEFTTVNGVVEIPGLWAGANPAGSVTYWLVELVAPDGYILDSTPRPVVVTASTVATPVEVLVPNPQEPLISLPLTGGSGTALLMTAGAGMLIAAIGVAVFAARRRTAVEHHDA